MGLFGSCCSSRKTIVQPGNTQSNPKPAGKETEGRTSVDEFYDAQEVLDSEDNNQNAEHKVENLNKKIKSELSSGKQKRLSLDLMLKDQEFATTNEGLALTNLRNEYAHLGLCDSMLCRFLRARHWNVSKASALLTKYLEWRKEMKPEDITWDDIEEEFRTGKVYRLSIEDNLGRNVMVLSPGKQNTKNHKQQMKQLVYTLESAIALKASKIEVRKQMHNPPAKTPVQEQIVILLDFTGYTLMNAPPLKVSMETLKILQDCYCERLGEALLLNPPTVFRVLWNLLHPFMDKRTLAKIKFLPRKFQNCRILAERFNLEELDESLGGCGHFPYDHEEYAEMMKAEDIARKSSKVTI